MKFFAHTIHAARTGMVAALLAVFMTGLSPHTAEASEVYSGNSFRLRHRGMVRNMFTVSSTVPLPGVPSEDYVHDILRARTDWFGSFDWGLSGSLVYDHAVHAGDYLETFEYRAFSEYEPVELVNLDAEILDRDRVNWRHRLYRLYLEYNSYPLRLTAGRQQVSWGTGYFWNPTDLFNPVTFAMVEPGERHGADAVNVEISLGTLSQLQAVWAPARRSGEDRAAVSVGTNLRGYDFSVMGGRFFGDNVLGADFSGQIGGAGFRGEWLHSFSDDMGDYDQLVLGADYRFSREFMLTGEYLYNSGALGSVTDIVGLAERTRTGGVFTLAEHLAGVYVTCQVTPLLTAEGYVSIDLAEGSFFLGPRISYNVLQDLDLEAGAMLSAGEGEYGLVENTFYAGLSWYF